MREIDNMKKLTAIFTGLALALSIVTSVMGVTLYNVTDDQIQEQKVDAMVQELRDNSNGSKYLTKSSYKAVEATQAIEDSTPYADEYDFFTYEITNIYNGDEINGVGLDNDGGIVLSKAHDGVDLQVGDYITVVFEKGVEDAIVDVQKLVLTEDNTYVAHSFYN